MTVTPFPRTQPATTVQSTSAPDVPEVTALLMGQLRGGDADFLPAFASTLLESTRRGITPMVRGRLKLLAAVAANAYPDESEFDDEEDIIDQACSSLAQQFNDDHVAIIGAGIASAILTLNYQGLQQLSRAVESSMALEEDFALEKHWNSKPVSEDYGFLLMCRDLIQQALTYEFPVLDETAQLVLRMISTHRNIRFSLLLQRCRRRHSLDESELRQILKEFASYQLVLPVRVAGLNDERYRIGPYGNMAVMAQRSPVAGYLAAA